MKKNKKWLRSLFIIFAALSMALVLTTTRANAESGNTGDTAVLFPVLGYDETEVAKGESAWENSEMNLSLKAVYPYEKLSSGYVIVKMNADINKIPDTEITMEFLINEANYFSNMMSRAGIHVENKSVLFYSVDGGGSAYVENGKVYVTLLVPYVNEEYLTVRSNVLKFTLKTHSTSPETSGLFSLTEITVCDTLNGEYTVELDKAIYVCEKLVYFEEAHFPLEFSVVKNNSIVKIEDNKLIDFLPKESLPTVLGNSSIYFGNTTDKVPYITGKIPVGKLTNGVIQNVICIPDGELSDGDYTLECTWKEQGGKFELKTTETISVISGVAKSDTSFRNNGKTFVLPTYAYKGMALATSNSNLTVNVSLKDANNNPVNSFYLEKVLMADERSGAAALDLSGASLCKGAVRKSSNYDIAVVNKPASFVVGEEYSPEIISDIYSGKKEIVIMSSDEKIAKVVTGEANTTVIKAIAPGKATITVTDKTNNCRYVFEQEVVCRYVFEQEVVSPCFSLLTERKTIPVNGQYYFGVKANGFKADAKKWSSSNKAVGTIDEKTGLFTAKKVGKTNISVADKNGYSLTFEVSVVATDYVLSDHFSVVTDPEAPELTARLLEHFKAIYFPMMVMFGGEDRLPYYEASFKNLGGTGAAAYVTDDPLYGGDELHYLMIIGSDTMKDNPEDIDCTTHELMHVAQGYLNDVDAYGNSARWLTEGLADYGRYVFAQNDDKSGWTLMEYYSGATYDTGYGVTGSFIRFVAEQYEPCIAECLNEIMKKHAYTDKIWEDVTGYTVEELWKKFVVYSWLTLL